MACGNLPSESETFAGFVRSTPIDKFELAIDFHGELPLPGFYQPELPGFRFEFVPQPFPSRLEAGTLGIREDFRVVLEGPEVEQGLPAIPFRKDLAEDKGGYPGNQAVPVQEHKLRRLLVLESESRFRHSEQVIIFALQFEPLRGIVQGKPFDDIREIVLAGIVAVPFLEPGITDLGQEKRRIVHAALCQRDGLQIRTKEILFHQDDVPIPDQGFLEPEPRLIGPLPERDYGSESLAIDLEFLAGDFPFGIREDIIGMQAIGDHAGFLVGSQSEELGEHLHPQYRRSGKKERAPEIGVPVRSE